MNIIKQIAIVFSCVVFLHFVSGAQSGAVKIACVGDNITYGDGMQTRARNNYPAQLQAMLGPGHLVENFGLPEANMNVVKTLTDTTTSFYSLITSFRPAMILLMMPAAEKQWINEDLKPDNAINLIVSYLRRKLPAARIILVAPPPVFIVDSAMHADAFTATQLIPSMQSVAYSRSIEVINLFPSFDQRQDLFPDSVHMCSLGATLIAKRLYERVMLKTIPFNLFSKIKQPQSRSSFFSYACVDFTFMSRNCKVVQPKVAAKGLPWVWRARFWGHEPQTDIALLERGYHIVYCDVSELYGNKEAINTWNAFYTLMHSAGLSSKPALEGMSRGGIYMYNWALANPGKVACIYADAPVLDMKSWPGGKLKGPGSRDDWETFKKDFTLTEEQAMNYNNSPLNRAAKIAKLNIPMLHVVGDADEVVPVDENTGPFEKIIKQSGGDITVIHKPGILHHPHSLANPEPIVTFILRNTGQKINFATLPVPGSEYRSGAGWVEGTGWWDNYDNINLQLKKQPGLDIIFLGNSITQGIAGHRENLTYRPGLPVFDSVFNRYKWECAGISGDRTQHLLWRLKHGAYKEVHPALIVVTIGVNNFSEDTPENVTAGIDSIVRLIRRSMPTTKILLIGPLPCGVHPDDMLRQKYNAVHSKLAMMKRDKFITYLPLTKVFIQEDGQLNLALCSGDGIHLIDAGYRNWALAMKPVIDQLLK